MRTKYLTYKKAIDLCLNHQELIGTEFMPGDRASGKIARILVAPYNKILQWQFLNDVLNGADAEKALGLCRDGKYEVILIPDCYKPNELNHRPKSLCAYLAERPSAAAGESPASRELRLAGKRMVG